MSSAFSTKNFANDNEKQRKELGKHSDKEVTKQVNSLFYRYINVYNKI